MSTTGRETGATLYQTAPQQHLGEPVLFTGHRDPGRLGPERDAPAGANARCGDPGVDHRRKHPSPTPLSVPAGTRLRFQPDYPDVCYDVLELGAAAADIPNACYAGRSSR